jgi:hypothetical protein
MAPVSKGLLGINEERILVAAKLYGLAAGPLNGATRRHIAKILTFSVYHGASGALYQKR